MAGQPDKRTSYQGNFIYRNDSLQYILTAEGRTIVYPQVDSPAKEEYFVKDHLGNVRSTIDVITYWTRRYLATYEIASANLEGLIFDNLNEIRDNKPGSTDPNDASSGRLNGSEPDHRLGTSLLVKVMAGDKVDLKVNNYYDGAYNAADDNPVETDKMLGAILSTLTGGSGGLGSSENHDTKLVDRLFTEGNYAAYQGLVDNNTDPSKPKAYLNYVFFDENMKIVTQASGAFQANGNGSWSEIGTGVPMVIIRQNNGPQIVGRALGFGTQRTAAALRGTLGVVSKVGKVVGIVGYGFQVASIGSKVINGESISKAEGVSFGVSTVLVGAGAIAAGTVAAPFVAGAALIYGVAELGSWLFTGNTLEENIWGK